MDFQYVREALNVQDSEVIESRFCNANMKGARFTDVNLSDAAWVNVNLTRASISDANLTGMTIDGVLVSELFAAYRARAK